MKWMKYVDIARAEDVGVAVQVADHLVVGEYTGFVFADALEGDFGHGSLHTVEVRRWRATPCPAARLALGKRTSGSRTVGAGLRPA